MGRDPPAGGDRKALRPSDRAAFALLAAYGGRRSGDATAPGRHSDAARRPAGSVPGPNQGPVGQVSRLVGRAHPRGDCPRTAGLYRQCHRAAPLLAHDSSGTRPRLPGSALRTRPGDAGRLGRMRSRAGGLDHPQGLGVRGRALLQPTALHRVHPVAAQGRVLPQSGQCPDLLRWQSPQPDLRQPQGGRAQRLGTQCLFPSRVPGAVRLLLYATGRLRAARPGIERGGRGRCALRQTQRPGRPDRGADPLRGLPGPGALLARSGGQPAATRDHPRAATRSLPAGAHPAAAAARHSLRHRRSRAGCRQPACPHCF